MGTRSKIIGETRLNFWFMRPEEKIVAELIVLTVQEALKNIREGLESGSITEFEKVEKFVDGIELIMETLDC